MLLLCSGPVLRQRRNRTDRQQKTHLPTHTKSSHHQLPRKSSSRNHDGSVLDHVRVSRLGRQADSSLVLPAAPTNDILKEDIRVPFVAQDISALSTVPSTSAPTPVMAKINHASVRRLPRRRESEMPNSQPKKASEVDKRRRKSVSVARIKRSSSFD